MSTTPSTRDDAGEPATIRDRTDFGRRLTVLRERAGLTVRDLAKQADLPFTTLQGYLTGDHLPSLNNTAPLLNVLRSVGVIDSAAHEAWLDAYRRVRRRRSGNTTSPYPGLRPFTPSESTLFYGRDALLDVLWRALADEAAAEAPLVVVGASGAGKSSLVAAGLLPRAIAEHYSQAVIVTPSDGAGQRLRQVIEEVAAAPQARGDKALLVIDQAEEIFTLGVGEEADQLIEALAGLSRSRGVTVCLTLRADFYTDALRYSYLRDGLQRRQVVVGALTQDELREAIMEPARQVGAAVDAGLADVVMRDLTPRHGVGGVGAAHDPGALPLLSHALFETWQQAGGALTIDGYRAIGGIQGAVAATAEKAIEGLDPSAVEVVRQTFLRLITVSEDGTPTRRVVARSELVDTVAGADGGAVTRTSAIVERFVDARLVTVDQASVALTHEALIAAWPRLSSWVDDDRAGLLVHRRLREAAASWSMDGDEQQLYGGARLSGARDWASDPTHAARVTASERRFLDASIDRQEAQLRSARRRTRRLQAVSAGLVVAVVAVAGLAVYGFRLRDSARSQRDEALSRQLAEVANRVRAIDPAVAAHIAVLAADTSATVEARSALLDTSATPVGTRLRGPGGPAAVATAGDLVAAVGDTGGLRVWRVTPRPDPGVAGFDVAQLADLPATAEGPLYAVAVSHEGDLIVAAGGDGTVLRWRVDDAELTPLSPLQAGGGDTVYALALDPAGSALAAASSSGSAILWSDARDEAPIPIELDVADDQTAAQSVAFGPEGLLTAGNANGTVRLWRVDGVSTPDGTLAPTVVRDIQLSDAAVTALAFDDKGALAAASRDQQIYVWQEAATDLTSGPTVFADAGNWATTVGFSPDGTVVVAGSSDNYLRLYDVDTGTLSLELPHPGPVTAGIFTTAGDAVISGAADGVVRVWPYPPPVALMAGGRAFTLAYTDDGRLATVNSANEARLFDVTRPGQPTAASEVLSVGQAEQITGAGAITPDARLLLAGGEDGSLHAWDITGRRPGPVVSAKTQTQLIEFVATSPDGDTAATASDDGTVQLWDLTDSQGLAPIGEPFQRTGGFAFTLAFSPDGDTLVVGGGSPNVVNVWDISTLDAPRPVGEPIEGPELQIYSIAYSPNGNTVALGSADRTVRLLDMTGPDGATWLGDPLRGPANYVYGVTFSPDGASLAAASGDGVVRIWDIGDPTTPRITDILTAGNVGPLYGVAYDPTGSLVSAAGVGRSVFTWQASPAATRERACALSGDAPTAQEWQQYLPSIPQVRPCEVS